MTTEELREILDARFNEDASEDYDVFAELVSVIHAASEIALDLEVDSPEGLTQRLYVIHLLTTERSER